MNHPTSMICPSCGNLISTEETVCPICGAKRPNLFGLGPYLTRLFGQQIDILTIIPTACIALYILSLALDVGSALNFSGSVFDMLRPGDDPLTFLGITYPGGPWWTNLTAIYLHGSLMHVLFNILILRRLSDEVGRVFGPARYFIIFTAAGVLGFIASNDLAAFFPWLSFLMGRGGAPTVGASGAIFGLLGALIVYGRRHSVSDIETRQLWGWAILFFISGLMGIRVNNWAHLGGFLGGWMAARMLVDGASYRESRLVTLAALGLLALTAAAFVMTAITYWPYLF